jgi:hypothetical protein
LWSAWFGISGTLFFWNIEASLREQEESTEALEMHLDGSLFNDMEGRWIRGGDQTKAGALMLREWSISEGCLNYNGKYD